MIGPIVMTQIWPKKCIFRNYLLPFSFLVYYSDKGSSSNLVFFYTPFLFFYTPFLFFYTTFWAYSQVPLKLWLNASSRHGDTLPSVFSINKKEICIFWHSSICAPRGIRTHNAVITGRGCLTYEATEPLTKMLQFWEIIYVIRGV